MNANPKGHPIRRVLLGQLTKTQTRYTTGLSPSSLTMQFTAAVSWSLGGAWCAQVGSYSLRSCRTEVGHQGLLRLWPVSFAFSSGWERIGQ